MRIHELLREDPQVTFSDQYKARQAQTANRSATQTVKNSVDTKNVLSKIAKGDWRGAILAGALGVVPQLKDSLTADQFDMLTHAANTQGAADFMGGLARYAASKGLPWLAGATAPVAALIGGLTYSGNAGDPKEDEFFKQQRWRREADEWKAQQAQIQAAMAAQRPKLDPKHGKQ